MMPMSNEWIVAKPSHLERASSSYLTWPSPICSAAAMMDETWNLLVGLYDIERRVTNGRISAIWNGQSANIIHFAGAGRARFREWRGIFTHGGASLDEVHTPRSS